jgi:hypothetical protein
LNSSAGGSTQLRETVSKRLFNESIPAGYNSVSRCRLDDSIAIIIYGIDGRHCRKLKFNGDNIIRTIPSTDFLLFVSKSYLVGLT